MNVLLGTLTVLGIVVAVAAITALAVRAIIRDKEHRGTGTLSAAALEVQSLLEPGKKKVVEAMHEMKEREDEDASGED